MTRSPNETEVQSIGSETTPGNFKSSLVLWTKPDGDGKLFRCLQESYKGKDQMLVVRIEIVGNYGLRIWQVMPCISRCTNYRTVLYDSIYFNKDRNHSWIKF